jgi:hypothetical protein
LKTEWRLEILKDKSHSHALRLVPVALTQPRSDGRVA